MTAYKNTEQLVLKLNEYYHDLVGDEYENLHPEIFKDEGKRWHRAGRIYLTGRRHPLRILDLGSGSGFVPSRLTGFLEPEDTFICSDISRKILEKCRQNMIEHAPSCRMEFVKTDGRTICLQNSSVDIITMNSFLHHVHDLQGLYSEVSRVLKSGGFVIVGHEPNRPFFSHGFLWDNYAVLAFLRNRLHTVFQNKRAGSFEKHEHNIQARIFKSLNRRLIDSGVISKPLSGQKISEIIDIQSCTAGGLHRNRPDLAASLMRGLPGFEIWEKQTYHHLYKLSFINLWTKWYNALLKIFFPGCGAQFFMVLRKGGQVK